MIRKYGDMFEAINEATFFLVTGNSYITRDGRVVMGRGAALQLKNMVPSIDGAFAREIGTGGCYGNDYGIVWHMPYGLFQVKRHFKSRAIMSLIQWSTLKLKRYAKEMPEAIYFLNFPGIGYGGLGAEKEKILRVIQKLPDNVWVWERENEKE